MTTHIHQSWITLKNLILCRWATELGPLTRDPWDAVDRDFINKGRVSTISHSQRTLELRISGDLPAFSQHFPSISRAFLWVFPAFSQHFPGISLGFPSIFPAFPQHFPGISLGFPSIFPAFSQHFPAFPRVFPAFPSIFPRGFPQPFGV